MRVIYQDGGFRITETEDQDFTLEDLKGDCFNPKYSDRERADLEREEKAFEREVRDEGVFGYCLEKWNPEGWEHVDSCYGFIGQYDENPEARYHHYIVEELKDRITEMQLDDSISI